MVNPFPSDKMPAHAVLVHDLKTCIAIIRGYSQLLRREHQKLGLEQPRLHQCTKAVLEQTDRLTALVSTWPASAGERDTDGCRRSCSEEDAVMELSKAEGHQMERKHVFCVNGSSDFLDLIRELLEEEHYNVTTTNFVPRTFQQIAALQPSLLVIDLAIGRQAGWALLEQLRREAQTNHIPVIVASTDPDLLEQVQADPHRYGGDSFISKPLDLDELLAGIRGLIGEA